MTRKIDIQVICNLSVRVENSSPRYKHLSTLSWLLLRFQTPLILRTCSTACLSSLDTLLQTLRLLHTINVCHLPDVGTSLNPLDTGSALMIATFDGWLDSLLILRHSHPLRHCGSFGVSITPIKRNIKYKQAIGTYLAHMGWSAKTSVRCTFNAFISPLSSILIVRSLTTSKPSRALTSPSECHCKHHRLVIIQ